MSVGPVMLRELREESRRPATYWLRVGCGLVLGGAVGWMIFGTPFEMNFGGVALTGSHILGARLFGAVNAALLIALALLTPLLTADTLSRERREGTLGLLFLTPLTARGIVLGKTLVHLLRGATLFLTLLPGLIVPVTLGGVGWHEVLLAILINSCVLMLGLTAGLLATSQAKDWTRAVLLAEVYSLILCCGLMSWHRSGLEAVAQIPNGWLATALGASPMSANAQTMMWYGDPGGGPLQTWLRLGGFTVNAGMTVSWGPGGPSADTPWNMMLGRLGPGGPQVWLRWATTLVACSFVGLLGSMLVAGRQARRSWQELPPSAAQQRLEARFLKPRYWTGLFRGRMRRSLDRNPIGWLHQFSAGARLVKWGWCLVAVFFEVLMVGSGSGINYLDELRNGQSRLGALLLGGLAFSAAASFRREKESGALELILVTPLSPRQIIRGRLRGIAEQFAPAFLVILLARTLVDNLWRQPADWITLLQFFLPLAIAAGLTATAGLYFSTFRLSILTAWFCTWASSLFITEVAWRLPLLLIILLRTQSAEYVVMTATRLQAGMPQATQVLVSPFALFELALRWILPLLAAWWLAKQLRLRLERRRFVVS